MRVFNKEKFLEQIRKEYMEKKDFAEKNDGKEVSEVPGIDNLGLLDGQGIDLKFTDEEQEDFLVIVDQEGSAITLKNQDNLDLIYGALEKCNLISNHTVSDDILNQIK